MTSVSDFVGVGVEAHIDLHRREPERALFEVT